MSRTEESHLRPSYRASLVVILLTMIAALSFILGVLFSGQIANAQTSERKSKVNSRGKTYLDFEGLEIDGELKRPGEFYFKHRFQKEFSSLVSRRKNFHQEMLRDVVQVR